MSTILMNKKRRESIRAELDKMKTGERVSSTLKDTGLGLLVGATGVGIATLLPPPFAFWGGVATALTGAYLGEPLAVTGGLSMSVAGWMTPEDKDPEKSAGEKIKDRFAGLMDNLKRNTGVTALTSKKDEENEAEIPADDPDKQTPTVEGFSVPLSPLNVSALDEIEQQLIASAVEFKAANPDVENVSEEFTEFEDEDEPDFSAL